MNHSLAKFFALLACSVLLDACSVTLRSGLDARASQANLSSSDMPVQPAIQTASQLQQLVAPIALYPDVLVAQILAASTYPDEIVEADRWLQDHSGLQGDQLAAQVDKQAWDSAVKALTEFPAVLGNMDKNLAWTSSLGDAYANQQNDVMAAIQSMRQLAQKAGTLSSNDQQTVTKEGKTIAIEPANTEIVYVPQYNPWIAFGAPIGAWPGWYPYPGLFWEGPGLGFGLGFNIGFFGGFGWGWHHWGADWHHGGVVYNHNTYVSHSRTVINRRVMAARPGAFRPGSVPHDGGALHGGARPAPRSGAFGGFNHGGVTRTFGARGRASVGGGSHAPSGGFHGGGRR